MSYLSKETDTQAPATQISLVQTKISTLMEFPPEARQLFTHSLERLHIPPQPFHTIKTSGGIWVPFGQGKTQVSRGDALQIFRVPFFYFYFLNLTLKDETRVVFGILKDIFFLPELELPIWLVVQRLQPAKLQYEESNGIPILCPIDNGLQMFPANDIFTITLASQILKTETQLYLLPL